jgi:Ca-activated chloride channel family protein
MSWFRTIGTFEIVSIAAFLICYIIYIVRIIRINKSLGTSYAGVFTKIGLRTIYFTLFIIAMLGPSFGNDTKEIKSVGKDILIAIDLSQSMNAFDVQPTRLEKVKYELNKIVAEFSSDRIGLIIFSSEAFVQCPLTYDQAALNLFIETLGSNLVPNTGTDFGPALTMALDKLDSDETTTVDQKAKIIILISDGEDFGEETSNVRDEVKNRGIKLFTLGVGTTTGSKIQIAKGYKKDQQGNDVVTKLDRTSLKELAARTGGKYFEINDRQNDVNRLINTINDVEGALRDARVVDVSSNKYIYFLLAALVLLLLDNLIPVKTVSI